MADAYIGEIRIFAGNFAPRDWAFCNGQLMQIRQFTALFAILGVQYGGDGKNTFALPNLMGRAPMNQGAGQGLTPRIVGQVTGSPTATLLTTEIPSHTHIPQSVNAVGSDTNPSGNFWAQSPPEGRPGREKQRNLYDATPSVQMNRVILPLAGGSQPHNNMQPYLALNYIICLYGDFPPRQ
ncbi:tail fiber protein [Paenibacillus chitinolyticus]|uniref:phage tail protein n=1 Tax=Paenibacillus chitinolyticus TaxID=79263 RepID=UPI002DB74328|nr:tail fiber protein [Paenibacillus chitinolyticus]MEC0244591.1 tail fiber protein [Paenibacillus chitinolyticus]